LELETGGGAAAGTKNSNRSCTRGAWYKLVALLVCVVLLLGVCLGFGLKKHAASSPRNTCIGRSGNAVINWSLNATLRVGDPFFGMVCS
jgi:hypothetical protein